MYYADGIHGLIGYVYLSLNYFSFKEEIKSSIPCVVRCDERFRCGTFYLYI